MVDDQYPRSIPPDSQLGMTSFRIFTIDIDPATDSARYVTMQGYDYTTGIMDAFDQTGVNMPGDKRFLMASGPFHLAPGDSAATCVAVMAAHDTLTIRSLSDDAQIIYDNGFATLPITVTSPNGGEVVSGDVAINWTADAPACSLNLYYSADEGMNWTLIADSLPNTGSYSWNTLPLPDGVRYMVSAFIYGNTIFGGDCSDGCFTVNNAAFNAAPEIKLVYPARGSYATGDQHIKYFFGQADGGVCRIDFQLRGTAGTWDSLITVNRAAQLWTRDSLPWNTATVPNYPYYTMRARVNDYLDTVSVVSDTFVVYNYFPHADSIEHASGSSDAVIVNPYVWDQGQLTGHRYEFRFRNIGRGDLVGGVYQPRYKYDLWDTDLNTALLTDRGLSVTMNNAWWWDVPPVIDGFIPEVRYRQNVSTIAVDSGRVTTEAGTISADTLYVTNANTSSAWWMSRGADFEIRWKDTLVTVGGIDRLALTAVVWDMDNNVPVPLDTVSWNNQTRSSWAFGSLSGSPGRSFIDSTTIASRSFLFICGAQLYYNRGGSVARKMTWSTRPTTGEVWTLYTSGSKPPREGDVYSFVGAAGVDGLPGAPCGSFGLSQNAPNPFSGATEFGYQISRPGRVRLRVYNIAGQLVKTLRDEQQGAGFHGVRWDGRNDAGQRLSAGVYLYRLQAGDRTMTRKLVLVK
ncbi:MAG: T9SS type A sorting domain-containing protein [Candidatus Edwardsbacteria bacterium]|nr:T9SS type A sorting domain-containing protein [Candidatus Edwardsbacteria bacterium]